MAEEKKKLKWDKIANEVREEFKHPHSIEKIVKADGVEGWNCLLYTSPSPRD